MDKEIARWRALFMELLADIRHAQKTMDRRGCGDRTHSCMFYARLKLNENAAVMLQACGGMASPW